MTKSLSVVMMGASGAVGGQVLATLLARGELSRLSLLGRREIALAPGKAQVTQHTIDVADASSYAPLIAGHLSAVCTLGVGESSKLSHEEFVRIDRDYVIAFAQACKAAGVRHFELLGSASANSKSPSFYLRTKGELADALVAMNFQRLSLFQPSMILTPINRYGFSQALTLAVWPKISPWMMGGLRKFRGVRVEALGAAMANNLFTEGAGVERLHWDEFRALAGG